MANFPDIHAPQYILSPSEGRMDSLGLEDLKRQLSPLACKMIKDDTLNKILTGSLEQLSLESIPINDEDLKILLSHCPKLTSLDLSESTFLSNEGLKALPQGIQHLFLRGLPNLTEDILFDLASFQSLETLDLSQTDFSLKNLSILQSLTHLKKLYLWQCRKLKDDDIAWIHNKMLIHLDISYCTSLTDTCLLSLTHIEFLDLDGINFLTANGLNCLSASEHLKRVSIERCPNIDISYLHHSLVSKILRVTILSKM